MIRGKYEKPSAFTMISCLLRMAQKRVKGFYNDSMPEMCFF